MDSEVVVLRKSDQTFLFLFTPKNRTELLREFGRMAADSDAPLFTWYDAAVLSKWVRDAVAESLGSIGPTPGRMGADLI